MSGDDGGRGRETNEARDGEEDLPGARRPEHILCVRVGHGANCSSMGSVVDTLFATATLGAALFAAVMAALGKEPVRVRAPRKATPTDRTEGDPPS